MDAEIREQVLRHLEGEFSLGDLEAWLTESTWDLNGVDDGVELAFTLQFLLAEWSQGHREESEVDRELRRLASTGTLGHPWNAATASLAVTERATRWTQPQIVGAGRRPSAVPA